MKKRLLCPNLPKPGKPTHLSEGEAHHAIQVLRLREGDIVEAMDGKGEYAFTRLRTKGGPPKLEYLEKDEVQKVIRKEFPILPVTLEMSVLKGDAMEWVVEKAVELGVAKLVPVLTDHTVVQMKSKGPESFQERWQKIADQSLKQCGRLHRLEVARPIELEELLILRSSGPDRLIRLWCDELSFEQSPYLLNWLVTFSPDASPVHLLIGPEGGWSTNERVLLNQPSKVYHSQRISLGPHVLRAETAAIFSMSLITAFALKRAQGTPC